MKHSLSIDAVRPFIPSHFRFNQGDAEQVCKTDRGKVLLVPVGQSRPKPGQECRISSLSVLRTEPLGDGSVIPVVAVLCELPPPADLSLLGSVPKQERAPKEPSRHGGRGCPGKKDDPLPHRGLGNLLTAPELRELNSRGKVAETKKAKGKSKEKTKK